MLQGPVSSGEDFHSRNRERGILKEAVHSLVAMGHKLNRSSIPPPFSARGERKRKENIIIGNLTPNLHHLFIIALFTL